MLLSLGPKLQKSAFGDEVLVNRDELRLPIFATIGTASMLNDMGVPCQVVGKTVAGEDSAVRAIEASGDPARPDAAIRPWGEGTGRPGKSDARRSDIRHLST